MGLSAKAKGACVLFGVLAAVGFVFWIYQLAFGLGVSGMSNAISWGLYITNFMFFVGLSAGGLIVASSASVFHITKYEKVALPAVICSTVSICVAAFFVLMDLGGIQRIWNILTSPNITSPLVWDMCVITIYLVINILDLVWLRKGNHRKVEVLSRFALPVAILVHSVTAWIFGLEIAREGWNTAIMAPVFVASACDSGLALLILALVGLDKAGTFTGDKKIVQSLAGLLAVFIAVDAYFIGCEVLTMAYAGGDMSLAILSEMLSGATAPFFWFEIIGGLLVPFLMLVLARNRARTGLVVVSSVLVICGVFCKRVWLLLSSFIPFNIEGASGVTLGTVTAQNGAYYDVWALQGSYFPTAIEFVISLGAISLGALAFIALSSKLLKKGVSAMPKAEDDLAQKKVTSDS